MLQGLVQTDIVALLQTALSYSVTAMERSQILFIRANVMKDLLVHIVMLAPMVMKVIQTVNFLGTPHVIQQVAEIMELVMIQLKSVNVI